MSETKQFDATDRRLIARLCGDLGTGLFPFRDVARELGLTEDEVLRRARQYKQRGLIRRCGAILRHQVAGFTGNGMSVWNVPQERVAEVGQCLAACPEISHCYERPRFAGWPYNMFGMIHAQRGEDCLALAARLAAELEISDWRVLFSLREFKKSSMVYFGSEGASA